jgi:hypothetical protein
MTSRLRGLLFAGAAMAITAPGVRATKDTGGSYLIHYRGVPRTIHVAYSYSF